MSFKGKKILGLIPARGGSKGIPGKNLKLVACRPLISYVCEAARSCDYFDNLILSSDSQEIIAAVRKLGIKTPFVRPADLAQDGSLIIDVIAHSLQWFKDKGEEFDYICLLQPTCPLAQGRDYKKAIEQAVANDADTVISVYPCGQEHPAVMFTRQESGRTDWFVKNLGWDRMARRQDLPSVYMRSGIVYVFKTELILKKKNLYGDKIFSILVPQERAVDINTALDLKLAELLLIAEGKTKGS